MVQLTAAMADPGLPAQDRRAAAAIRDAMIRAGYGGIDISQLFD